jgi:hypothetical protein
LRNGRSCSMVSSLERFESIVIVKSLRIMG